MRLKRTYDVFFSALGLLALLPLLVVVAAAVKCYDRGPVFFRQQRVGKGGHLFWIWKFRSMVVNAGLSAHDHHFEFPRVTAIPAGD